MSGLNGVVYPRPSPRTNDLSEATPGARSYSCTAGARPAFAQVPVEWTDYERMRVEAALVTPIAAPEQCTSPSFEPSLSYAKWLASDSGEGQQRSDESRFPDATTRDSVRAAHSRYQQNVLATANAHQNGER